MGDICLVVAETAAPAALIQIGRLWGWLDSWPWEVAPAPFASAWSRRRQPARMPCTLAAPRIGSAGTSRWAGWRMNGRVWRPPMPPWKQISSSKAQPSSSSGS